MSCPKYALHYPRETSMSAGKKLLKEPPLMFKKFYKISPRAPLNNPTKTQKWFGLVLTSEIDLKIPRPPQLAKKYGLPRKSL